MEKWNSETLTFDILTLFSSFLLNDVGWYVYIIVYSRVFGFLDIICLLSVCCLFNIKKYSKKKLWIPIFVFVVYRICWQLYLTISNILENLTCVLKLFWDEQCVTKLGSFSWWIRIGQLLYQKLPSKIVLNPMIDWKFVNQNQILIKLSFSNVLYIKTKKNNAQNRVLVYDLNI
jgi:hypothetical protein